MSAELFVVLEQAPHWYRSEPTRRRSFTEQTGQRLVGDGLSAVMNASFLISEMGTGLRSGPSGPLYRERVRSGPQYSALVEAD